MKKVILLSVFILIFTTFVVPQKKEKERVAIDDNQNFLVISTKKISTLEKELDEVSAKGFRILFAAPAKNFNIALFLK